MDTENKTEQRTQNTEYRVKGAAIFYITNNGLTLAQKLKKFYPDAQIIKFKPEAVSNIWNTFKSFIFIMATGIVVRTIASLIKDKKIDPAVVVIDEKGKYAISLLSGHLGGANDAAREVADFLGGEAVITTASDANNMPSIDLWTRDNDLTLEDWEIVPHIATRFLNNGVLKIYVQGTEDSSQASAINLPDGFLQVSEPISADLLVTNKNRLMTYSPQFKTKARLYLRPKNLVIGIGCNRGASEIEIEDAVRKTFEEHNLSFLSIHSIGTIDIKASENGLIAFAQKYNLGVNAFSPEELNTVQGIQKSEAVHKATGANAVAEPAAILASVADTLIVPKQKIGNVTVAVAELRKEKRQARLYIVGTGPGSIEHITPYAQKVIKRSDVIVGYGTYIDLIRELIKDKEVVCTGMTQEIERCKKAVEYAISGKSVSLISGGDPGIYAMAGPVFEILKAKSTGSEIHIEVIPGVPALSACAARLGAPLMHDFAVISLSDRLTQWEVIEERLVAAASADFVIVLYNPKSSMRTEQIQRAREIFMKHRSSETPVGIVKSVTREDEKVIITNLKDMLNHEIDMQTTIIIGNSKSFVWLNWMITPRGYKV
jgi:cobalt-precorrin 5A hydrolase/precorrin-3B C17-methyltransferase